VRGTNPYGTESRPRLPVLDDPETHYHGSSLLLVVLGKLGYEMAVDKDRASVRNPLWFVSRFNNGFYFTGYTPSTTVRSRFRFPFGAPLLIGWDARIERGYAAYHFGRSYHEECRVFVQQERDGVVGCSEMPTRNESLRRRIAVSGLEGATLRLFREADCLDRPVHVARDKGAFMRGVEGDVPTELSGNGRQVVVRNVSGGVVFSW
jgi:hypothetical protein